MKKARYSRRRRRQRKMKLRSGGKFKVGHKLIAGRTGTVHSKRTPSKKRMFYRTHRPNPASPSTRLGEFR